MSYFEKRLEKLRDELKTHDLQAMFVTHLTNVRYLSGFTGSAGAMLVTETEAHFLSDRRYEEQAVKEVPHCEVHMIERGYLDTLAQKGVLDTVKTIGFEGQYLPFVAFQRIQKTYPKHSWNSVSGLIERLAAVKDSEEIASLKEAARITDFVFTEIQNDLKVGVKERELAAKISYLFKMNGADGDSYDPIVASGPNSALPHAHPGERAFEKGDFIVMDFAALYNGYHADMTRTVVIGEASDKHHEIYQLVLKSQLAGIAVAKAGMTGADLDKVCRDIIDKAGYGNEFCHSTGHGIGLEVHTHPTVSGGNKEPLLENYVITIEPGVYIPSWGGVRIEDDCWIQEYGCEVLNASTKALLVL
jgi:Xaa-Pro aminopeptidase